MTEPPSWWKSLVADPITERLGIDWQDPGDWKPVDDGWSGTMSNQFIDALDSRNRQGKLKVGTGPAVTRRAIDIQESVSWHIDPEDPDRLWCALGEFYAAWLWIPIEPTAQAIEETLAASHPKPSHSRIDFNRMCRGIIDYKSNLRIPQAYTGDAVRFNGHDLDRNFAGVQYVEPSMWGSAHQNDPLRDDFEPVSMVALSAAARNSNANAQRLGRIPSMTWRTLHSRSYVSFEIHMRGLVCAMARYQPSPISHQAVVERINAEFETDYPLDLPLDVIGALTGFGYTSAADLSSRLDEPESPQQLASAIRFFAALWSGDLRAILRLREFTGHEDPDVRMALARVAHWYGYRFLAEELALTETDADRLAGLESLLLNGSAADNYNAFDDYFDGQATMLDRNGDPVETWSDSPGEEAADEEDQ